MSALPAASAGTALDPADAPPLLRVRDLVKRFPIKGGFSAARSRRCTR